MPANMNSESRNVRKPWFIRVFWGRPEFESRRRTVKMTEKRLVFEQLELSLVLFQRLASGHGRMTSERVERRELTVDEDTYVLEGIWESKRILWWMTIFENFHQGVSGMNRQQCGC